MRTVVPCDLAGEPAKLSDCDFVVTLEIQSGALHKLLVHASTLPINSGLSEILDDLEQQGYSQLTKRLRNFA